MFGPHSDEILAVKIQRDLGSMHSIVSQTNIKLRILSITHSQAFAIT